MSVPGPLFGGMLIWPPIMTTFRQLVRLIGPVDYGSLQHIATATANGLGACRYAHILNWVVCVTGRRPRKALAPLLY